MDKIAQFLGLFALMAILPRATLALEKGELCPEFQVKAKDSSLINSTDFKGNVVYLDFWASWCAPCKKSLPWMNEIQKKYSAQGLKVVAINLDSNLKDADKMIAAQTELSFKLAFDPNLSTPEIFDVSHMPTSFLIDRNGKIYEVFKGFDESEKEIIEQKIDALLKE